MVRIVQFRLDRPEPVLANHIGFHTYESSKTNRALFSAGRLPSWALGKENARAFLRHFILKVIIYQDRLGTNIGKTQQREMRFP
jgi:hypothetical protein